MLPVPTPSVLPIFTMPVPPDPIGSQRHPRYCKSYAKSSKVARIPNRWLTVRGGFRCLRLHVAHS